MSLDKCACACNFQPAMNLMVLLPEKLHPIQHLFYEKDKAAYEELMHTVSVLYDFKESEAPELLRKKNEQFASVIKNIPQIAASVTKQQLKQQFEKSYETRGSYFFEELALQLEEVSGSLLTLFMERFGNLPGLFCVLGEGSPVSIGEGEYLVVERSNGSFIELLNSAFEGKSNLDILKTVQLVPKVLKEQFVYQIGDTFVNRELKTVLQLSNLKFTVQFESQADKVIEIKQKGYLLQFSGSCTINNERKLVPLYYKLSGEEAVEARLMAGFGQQRIALMIFCEE